MAKNVTGNPLDSSAAGAITGNVGRSRVARHRAKHARLDVSMPPNILATIDEIAELARADRASVVRCMLRYALTNRDWKAQGLLWAFCRL